MRPFLRSGRVLALALPLLIQLLVSIWAAWIHYPGLLAFGVTGFVVGLWFTLQNAAISGAIAEHDRLAELVRGER